MTLYVEHLAPTDSPLARWDARWKLAAILLAAFAVAALRAWPPAVAACAGALVLAAVAELPGRWFRTRLFVLALALLPFLFILPLTLEGGQTWKLGPLAVSSRGVETAVLLAGKALAIGTLTLVLLATAPLTDTLAAARKLRLPGVLVQLTLLSYRYVFLLAEELRRLGVALRTRGYRNRPTRHGYRTIARVVGALLVRGQDRAERVAQAMRCRGFDGGFRTLTTFRTSPRDVALFAMLTLSAAALVGWDLWARS